MLWFGCLPVCLWLLSQYMNNGFDEMANSLLLNVACGICLKLAVLLNCTSNWLDGFMCCSLLAFTPSQPKWGVAVLTLQSLSLWTLIALMFVFYFFFLTLANCIFLCFLYFALIFFQSSSTSTLVCFCLQCWSENHYFCVSLDKYNNGQREVWTDLAGTERAPQTMSHYQ